MKKLSTRLRRAVESAQKENKDLETEKLEISCKDAEKILNLFNEVSKLTKLLIGSKHEYDKN